MRKYGEVPPPYRLRATPWNVQETLPASFLEVEIILFGRAVEYLPVVAEALLAGLIGGIGRQDRSGKRGTLDVTAVQDLWSSQIWSPALDRTWPRLDAVTYLANGAPSAIRPPIIPLRLEWTTPLRLMHEGGISSHPDFRTLIAALLRRIGSLLCFHEHVSLDLDFRKIVDLASKVKYCAEWKRLSLRRYSARQHQSMHQDGVIGGMTIEEDASLFLPLLRMGEITGVGKGTTLGMGVFKIEEQTERDICHS